MENIITKTYSNLFLLKFKDKKTAKLYYETKFSFKKFLIISFFSYCLILINLILLYILDQNESKSRIINLEIFLCIFEAILIILFIAWKRVTLKLQKDKHFYIMYFGLSIMNLFNIYLQPLISIESMSNIASSIVRDYLIPNIQYLLMITFIFFVENNFIIYFVNFVLTFVFIEAFSISKKWHDNPLIPLIILLCGLFFIIFIYFVNRRDKDLFILYRNALTDLEKKKSFVDNLNSGLVTINEKGSDYNLKVKEYLELDSHKTSILNFNLSQSNNKLILKNTLTNNYDSFSNLNFKNDDLGIKNLLFNHFIEFNPEIDLKLKEIFQRSENFNLHEYNEEKEIYYNNILVDLLNFMRENEKYQAYFFLGDKVLIKTEKRTSIYGNNMNSTNNHRCEITITLRVYLRYNIITRSLEFFLYDISPIIEVENLKASSKIKKLFLNKFSHEFKNPLLNIIQLVSNIKKRLKLETKNSGNKILKDYHDSNLNLSSASSNSNLRLSASNIYFNNSESIKEIKHVKNITMYLISLISDFDFISNTELMPINNAKLTSQNRLEIKTPLGQSLIEISKFKLSKLIKECVKILKSKIELSNKNIIVSYSIDEDIPHQINSDFRRLKQVISNILSNAFKFTSRGEISIYVRKEIYKENLIYFEISDTGNGFKPEILEMIQEGNMKMIFGNIKNNSNIYGCGIGLDLVQKIISLLGENFKIYSNKEVGSTISFSIYDKIKASKEKNIYKTSLQLNSIKNITNINNTERVKENYLKIDKYDNKWPPKIFEGNLKRKRSASVEIIPYLNLNLNSIKEATVPVINLNLLDDENLGNNDSKIINLNLKDSLIFGRDENNNQISKKIPSSKHISEDFDSKLVCDKINVSKKQVDSEEFKIEIINIDVPISIRLNDSECLREGNNTMVLNHFVKINTEDKLEMQFDRENEFEINSIKTYDKNSKSDSKIQLDPIIEGEDRSLQEEKKNNKEIITYLRVNNIAVNKQNKMNGRLDIFKTFRILLVDDEKFIRNSETNQIQKYFKFKPNFKYEIIECCDGVECLYKIFKGIQEGIKYDYIITDESMNFLRGTLMIKVLNNLIQENMMYNIKIFMVTSYEPWVIKNTYGNICDGIITKPLSCENLSKIFE